MTAQAWVWLGIFVGVLAFEVYTLIDRTPRTTLSRQVWWLRGQKMARPILVGSFAWLMYHWLFEDAIAAQTGVDDWSIVATAVLALYVRPERRENVK